MRRFFVEEELRAQKEISLTGDEFHHLRNVSRLEEGERAELLDGLGHIALAEITKITKKEALLSLLEIKKLPEPPHPHVEIVLCVPRFQKIDMIIEKCVELGVARLTPVVSERSFVKTLGADLLNKNERWQKISREACKQSGRAWPMALSEPGELTQVIKEKKNTTSLFLYEGQADQDIKSSLKRVSPPPKELVVFIGAEGGFSPKEVEAFREAGLKPVTLGSLVLRVETACIALMSIIQYEFDHMR